MTTILFLEDEELTSLLMRGLLKSESFELIFASSAEQALSVLDRVDVIVVDEDSEAEFDVMIDSVHSLKQPVLYQASNTEKKPSGFLAGATLVTKEELIQKTLDIISALPPQGEKTLH